MPWMEQMRDEAPNCAPFVSQGVCKENPSSAFEISEDTATRNTNRLRMSETLRNLAAAIAVIATSLADCFGGVALVTGLPNAARQVAMLQNLFQLPIQERPIRQDGTSRPAR